MTDYECPKCGVGYNATGSHEDAGEHECESCGFVFVVAVEYDPTYSVNCKVHVFGDIQTHSLGVYRACKLCHYTQWET
jgi:DNA-directed RNA polymerase subunit RPC12/RpoP